MKRRNTLKLKLKRALAWVERSKAKMESLGLSNREYTRARLSFLKYTVKAENIKAEIEARCEGKKKVMKEKKTHKARVKESLPNDSKQWLKPLRKNNLENKEMIKPVYF
jgi:hypothetical protein